LEPELEAKALISFSFFGHTDALSQVKMTIQTVQETWLQSYARASLFNLFRNIKHGHVTVICKYLPQSDSQHTTVFGNEDDDERTTITFNVPAAWDRIIRGFDLVRLYYSRCQSHFTDLLTFRWAYRE
jgi:hypothetical protein